jgi:phage FluMu protein gp41
MIVRFEQVNARGEASRPRVDLNALGALLDRAALGVEMLRRRLQAAGEIPGPAPRDLERDLISALRQVRSVRTRSRRRTPCTRR